jgi:hypothetical protein
VLADGEGRRRIDFPQLCDLRFALLQIIFTRFKLTYIINCVLAAALATIVAPQTGSNLLNSDKECMRHAAECVRLAGLTDDLNVRDQLVELAQNWIAAAQRERPRSGDERVVPLRNPRDDDARPLHDDSDDAKVVQMRDDESKS